MLQNMKFGDLHMIDFPFRRDCSFVQDHIHIGTKLRNRLLKASIELPMGNKIVTISHLKILINEVQKDIHGLSMKDICPDDRQNFGSLEKMMKPAALNALTDYIVGSQGTAMFLKLCHGITSSFCDEDLPPLERVYRIWRAIFFLRTWRKWILKSQSSKLNLSENFISSNAYNCIEINGNNLISAMRMFRDKNIPELFMPTLFSSQPCEEIFRKLRSMGTVNYTKINFNLLEVFHLISRVELLNDIIHFQLSGVDVKFPRNKINKSKSNHFELPSDIEIKDQINRAKIDAITDAEKLEMNASAYEINKCEIKNVNTLTNKQNNEIAQDESEDEMFTLSEHNNLREYPSQMTEDDSTPFVDVDIIGGNNKKTIRKSTYLSLLIESNGSISKDRLRRVQDVSKQKTCVRRLNFKSTISAESDIESNDEIKIGNWCVFSDGSVNNQKLVLGQIIAFQYITGKNLKHRQYSWDFAPTSISENEQNKRGIQVLAVWYGVELNGNLSATSLIHSSYRNINNYIATLANPLFDLSDNSKDLTSIDMNYFNSIKTRLFDLNNEKLHTLIER